MIFDFAERRVLITGGSNGIGLAIAQAFLAAGAAVAITGTRPGAGDYDHDLQRFEYHMCQMGDPSQIAGVAEAVGALDVLVNNAGQSRPGGRSEWESDVFAKVIEVDLLGGFRMATACQSALMASKMPGGASIVNNLSASVFFGEPLVPGYGAAKAALWQLTKTMAVQWACDGIRVNGVIPGLIMTRFSEALDRDEERKTAFLERIPLGRFGTPADIAPVVLFLASPEAAYITGTSVVADGGLLARN